jgi:hypothetical protein
VANSNFGGVQVSDGYAAPVSLLPSSLEVYQFFQGGGQSVGTEKQGILVPVAGTITDVRAYLSTAPTGSSFVVDVMKNGVTLFTTSANRPTIAAAANASSTTLPNVTAVAVGDQLRVDVIQVGATIAGSNLYVTVTVKQPNVA